jgi:hypothetical protein
MTDATSWAVLYGPSSHTTIVRLWIVLLFCVFHLTLCCKTFLHATRYLFTTASLVAKWQISRGRRPQRTNVQAVLANCVQRGVLSRHFLRILGLTSTTECLRAGSWTWDNSASPWQLPHRRLHMVAINVLYLFLFTVLNVTCNSLPDRWFLHVVQWGLAAQLNSV